MRRLLLALGLLISTGLLGLAPTASAASAAAGEVDGWTPVSCVCGNALSVDLVDVDRAFLGTDSGVSRTDDGGWTWRPTAFPVSGEVRRVSFADRDAGAVVGGFAGVVVTRDGGSTWTQYRPWPGRSYDVVALPDRWLGLAESGLYASTDGGRVWRKVHDPFLPLTSFQRMAWSSARDGVVSNGALTFTTTDGGRTFTSATTSAVFAFDAVSLAPGTGLVGGDRVAGSGRPWVTRVEASRHTPYLLAERGVAQEQVHGLAASGSTYYAVGVEGLLARSTDAGRTWSYERPPPSYERAAFYDVDALDPEHAIVAVHSGRVLLRQASTAHDVTTSPHRGAGLGLVAVALVAASGAGWVLVSRRPRALALGLAGAALAASVPAALLLASSRTCHPSGCDLVAVPSGADQALVPAPTTSPTPTATPSSAPPSATPSPTPSPSATVGPTPSATRSRPAIGQLTVSPLTADSYCTTERGAFLPGPVRLTLHNRSALPVAWTARASADQQQDLQAWAEVEPGSGTLLPGQRAVVIVTPDAAYCDPEREPATRTVSVSDGVTDTLVTITVHPPTG